MIMNILCDVIDDLGKIVFDLVLLILTLLIGGLLVFTIPLWWPFWLLGKLVNRKRN